MLAKQGDDHDNNTAMSSSSSSMLLNSSPQNTGATTSGIAGYLEIEEEPSRGDHFTEQQQHRQPLFDDDTDTETESELESNNISNDETDDDLLGLSYEPITTSSGLLLTHRQAPTRTDKSSRTTNARRQQQQQQSASFLSVPGVSLGNNGEMDSYENALSGTPSKNFGRYSTHSSKSYGTGTGMRSGIGSSSFLNRRSFSSSRSPLDKAKYLLSMTRIYVIVTSMVVFFGTIVVIHSIRHEHNQQGSVTQKNSSAGNSGVGNIKESFTIIDDEEEPERVILLPIDDVSQLKRNDDMQKKRRLTSTIHGGKHASKHNRRDNSKNHRDSEVHHHNTPDNHPNSIDDIHKNHQDHPVHIIEKLRSEFEEWIVHHEKTYHSPEEKEKRFGIWVDNHHKTIEKNKQHGPCKLTGNEVFGSNHMKDLTKDEFVSQYLTGYHGPTTDVIENDRRKATVKRTDEHHNNDGPLPGHHHHKNPHHHRRQTKEAADAVGPNHNNNVVLDPSPRGQNRRRAGFKAKTTEVPPNANSNYLYRSSSSKSFNPFYTSSSQCKWYNLPCWLRMVYYMFHSGLGGIMEPDYDANAFPDAVDWRNYGIVSDVHSQGNCGACWGITAVETIESAYALKTGTLIDLAETEVIVCDGTCSLCDGGWPQNAYEYVIDHNGLPAESEFSYDGNTLYYLTAGLNGESDDMDADYIDSYVAAICPDGYRVGAEGGNSGSGSGSGSNDGGDAAYSYEYQGSGDRYGKIRGYGYACERCICYTDGTGCDCDEQNESMAVRNVATYGPATVCLEASTWQDYAGGVITTDSGCSSKFLDMNHCVQTVGYAFYDSDEVYCEDGEDCGDMNWDEGNGGGSGSGSGSGSQDSGNREGYWIIRNQWSNGWGMNGYAYVAMGDNTCGVLNDMTQAYM